jgi:hypothetical protein
MKISKMHWEGLKKVLVSMIDMMIDRNKTSHIYDENEARAIYNKIKESHIHLLRQLRGRLDS